MIDVRRAAERFTTTEADRTTRHSFSFGTHYDPGNVGFASLVAHNDDRLAPDGGYGPHPHTDLEIVTWVLDGALRHEDSAGRSGEVTPGVVQRLSAGSGVRHSERAGGSSTRFVQMWVRPDESGLTPSYASGPAGADPLLALASGDRSVDAVVPVHAAGATLWLVRPGSPVALPDTASAHVFVARGAVSLEGVGDLAEGDAVRLTGADAGARVVTGPGELLVWTFRAE